jgi:type II secretory ATPase GspE/PulE/Tfp pilus assembly ATPase PilB-like protein
MLDLGIEPYLVSSSLIAVVAQRLVRVICEKCREPYTPTREEIESIGLKQEDVHGDTIFKGRGCNHCLGTGYWGRTGIYEILPVNENIRQRITERAPANEIKQWAVSAGMKTLRMDGAQKVLKGVTSIEEVVRVTQLDTF